MHRPPRFHRLISERNELFWPHQARSILNKLPTRYCWGGACGPYFDICNVYEVVSYDWLYSQY